MINLYNGFALILMTSLTAFCKKDDVELIFVGDISFSDVNYYLKENGNCSYEKSFSEIRKRLKADFKIGNLETGFGNAKNPGKERDEEKVITLLSHPSTVEALRYLGLDGVSVANNHFADYGEEAMKETLATLWKNKIRVSGISFGKHKYSDQEPLILEKNGMRIGVLAYCATEDGCFDADRNGSFVWPAIYKEKSAIEEIKNLRKSVDHVIIFMHWGEEYAAVAVDTNINIANTLHEYVDVIIGSHSHIPTEHYYINKTLVVDSLGNFLFPMKHTRHTVFKDRGSKKKVDGMKEMVSKYKNPSTIAEVVKIVFNRSGLVREKSVFAHFEITMDENNCFVIQTKKHSSEWKVICSKRDKKCAGTSTCNPVNCVEEKPDNPKNSKTSKHGKT